MNIPLFSRQPLSVPGKTAVGAVLGLTVLCGVMSFFSSVLLIIAALLWLSALLIALGIRWAPVPGIGLSVALLYIFLFKEPFPIYHLTHPKDALASVPISFIIFLVIVLLLWSAIVACWAGAVAMLQNYRRGAQQTPRWFASAMTGLIGFIIGVILIAAIAQPGAAATASTGGEATAHMGISGFLQSSVAVSKGAKLLLIDDGAFHHNLSTGTWVDGQPQSENLAGEPGVNNLDITGKSIEIGPFTTAGTYHIYCSIHNGMTLTIIVQ